MATGERGIAVVDNRDASRYELTVDGEDAGFIDYVLRDDSIVLSYIEIDPLFGGRGFGGRLTQAALDDCSSRGLTVIPTCPFITDYMRKHPVNATPSDGERRGWLRVFRSRS